MPGDQKNRRPDAGTAVIRAACGVKIMSYNNQECVNDSPNLAATFVDAAMISSKSQRIGWIRDKRSIESLNMRAYPSHFNILMLGFLWIKIRKQFLVLYVLNFSYP